MNNIYITHYCHIDCKPYNSITRLEKNEAFDMARLLAMNTDGKSFGRFMDFTNYYALRMKTEQWLYCEFVKNGGRPENMHPLYFVLDSAESLKVWFGDVKEYRLPLDKISEEHVSFTFGDSVSNFGKEKQQKLITKSKLYKLIDSYNGDVKAFLASTKPTYNYVEVQLWSDRYIKKQ